MVVFKMIFEIDERVRLLGKGGRERLDKWEGEKDFKGIVWVGCLFFRVMWIVRIFKRFLK